MLHAGVLVEASLLPAAGELAFSLPGPGAFALVVPDAGDAAPAIPAAGEALGGVPLAELPATAPSRALVQPAVLPPGAAAQARVTETFSLASGETASEDERPMDIVLFRAPCTAMAESGGVSTACPDTGTAALAARAPGRRAGPRAARRRWWCSPARRGSRSRAWRSEATPRSRCGRRRRCRASCLRAAVSGPSPGGPS